MGGKSSQTIGYHYIMTLLLGDCRGPVNEYLAIEGDDKIAWTGNASTAVPQKINSPDLFGGEQQEGGIQGAFIVLQGSRTQLLPGATTVSGIGGSGPCQSVTIPNIKTSIGGRVSELRGFVSLLYRGLVSSMNPYPKEWHLFRWRTTAGWYNDDCWYPVKATICVTSETGQQINAMNAAHIIYQTLTDPEWGASRSTSEIDENSFILAANTLCDERFGLCINWTRQEDVDTFLQSVINHVSGALYTDRATGKIVFKLIRNDYVVSDLPLYDFNSGLLEVTEDDSGSSDEIINEIIVKGKDQSLDGRGNDFEVRVHNNSARQAQGAISDTLDLPGLPTRDLGVRRGQMELAVHAPGLKRFKLKFDRRAWQLTPAAVIRISSPLNSISNMVVRLGDDIDYGNTIDGTIAVSAIEDVFGMPSVSFQATGGSSWTPPATTPEPAAATLLIEAGYRDIVRRIGTSNAEAVDPTLAYIGQLAKSPSHAYQYELLSKTSSETDFVNRASGSFTGEAVLSTDASALTTNLFCSDLGGITRSNIGEAIICGGEVMRLDDVNELTLVLTVARGCADTVPATHSTGAGAWLLDDDLTPDGREYATGETVQTKVLTRTSTALLDPSLAATDGVTVAARHYKPYPPGNVKVDSISVYSLAELHATPVLTWTHRDRLIEDDTLVEHGAGSVGPEVGTTYTIRVKTADSATLLRTTTGLTGTTWTYDSTMQTADGSHDIVLMELESVRDAVASWQMYSFLVGITALPGSGGSGNVVFLSGFEGGAAIDESPLGQTVTVHGSTAVSATQAKFGTQSLSRPDNGYASVPDNAAFFSGTSHFTVEGFFYWTSKILNEHGLIGNGDRTSDRGWSLYYNHGATSGSRYLDFELYDGTSFQDAITVLWEPTLATWYHIAVDFDGTKYRLYVDGVVLQATTASYSIQNTASPLTIGGYLDGGVVNSDFDGYMDEVRVTAGAAQYATDVGFTPPTAPFPR